MTLKNEMYTIVGRSASPLGSSKNASDTVQLRLNADHPIYRAHFPGNPITPGVCLVKIVSEVVGQQLGCPLQLRRIANLKFISVISPVETPLLDLHYQVDGVSPYRVKGTFSHDGQVYTKFSLELSEP